MLADRREESCLARELLAANFDSPYHAVSLAPHVGQGFSGASIWHVQAAAGEFCWRQYPAEHPTSERLRFIHEVLFNAARGGCNVLATPLPTRNGNSFVAASGRLWELSPWLAGEPRTGATITTHELSEAMHALAGFHRAVQDHPASGFSSRSVPAIVSRLRAIDQFDIWADDFRLTPMHDDASLAEALRKILSAYRRRHREMRATLTSVADDRFQQMPCLRDIWSEHVLFASGRVSGIIDYGAMAVDTPATDVARLLGSYAGNDRERWNSGIESYRARRELSSAEIHLASVLDSTGAILSGMNWILWLFRERRTFPDPIAVRDRVLAIATRVT